MVNLKNVHENINRQISMQDATLFTHTLSCTYLRTHSCQLVALSGTYPRTYNFLYLLSDSPCNAKSLIRWVASSQLINDHQRVTGGCLQR